MAVVLSYNSNTYGRDNLLRSRVKSLPWHLHQGSAVSGVQSTASPTGQMAKEIATAKQHTRRVMAQNLA